MEKQERLLNGQNMGNSEIRDTLLLTRSFNPKVKQTNACCLWVFGVRIYEAGL